MNHMNREKIKAHFQFSFKERMAFIMILFIVAIIFVYPFMFSNNEEQPLTIIKSSALNNNNREESNKENPNEDYHSKSYSAYKEPKKNSKLFYFDPNTAKEEQWQSLGLRDRTISTIKNYLSKGGSFKAKEDLKKIYGLYDDEYARLEPYINIPAKEKTKPSYKNFPRDPLYAKPINKAKRLTINDINTADAHAFIALPGIGDKLASRIVKFRDKLGGFYAVEQVGETYGLPDSTFQLIKQYLKLSSDVKKININTASNDELRQHPYIRWSAAKAIVEYRNQHGLFKSLDELKNIVVIDEAMFNKMQPYLTL
jgi:competence ComEA-like helix-hairpin-helix protein